MRRVIATLCPLMALATVSPAAAAGWQARIAAFAPPAQAGHVMAHDSAASRSVAFVKGATGAETWAWDGASWTHLAPPGDSPPARDGAAMVRDSARGRLVLYGGREPNGGKLGDTWELEGTVWHRSEGTSPSPGDLFLHGMAYDSSRQATVLFGGTRDESTPLAETWVWNGSIWTKLEPARSPPARFGHTMSFDSSRQAVVLFGGLGSGGQPLSDTWVWNGTDWTQRNPAPSPPARARSAMAYDPVRERVVLFGGAGSSDTNFGSADTWEWDGSAWTEKTSAAGSPSERSGAAMVFDASRARIVLFGGSNDNDLWEWDGSAWTERPPLNGPRPRAEAAMAFDTSRQRAVMFGGRRPSALTFFAFGDTWEWNGSAWAHRDAIDAPAPRYGHGMAYDEARESVLLFGGYDNHVGFYNDTWKWDGAVWTRLNPPASPPVRYQHAMAYDPVRQVVVLFGGSSGTLLSDTWEWDGSTWAARAPPAAPSARLGAGLAFDPSSGGMILFGGATFVAPNSETWGWNGVTWSGRSPESAPRPRSGHRMTLDPATAEIILFGGQTDTGFASDTWRWTGQTWSQIPLDQAPFGRSFPALVHDPSRRETLLFGGAPDQGFSVAGDTWSLPSLAPASGPANSAPVASAGPDREVVSGAFVTLSGSAVDPDSDELDYFWTRAGGTAPAIALFDAGSARASFTATAAGSHLFTLTVTDGRGGVGRDSATVTVTATQTCEGSQRRSIPVVEGLNLISMPLMPCGRAFDVRELMRISGAPFVARTTPAGRFEVYLPGLVPEWPIDGSHGYLIRMRAAGNLEITGEFWP